MASTIVQFDQTVLEAAVSVLGRKSLGPSEIAHEGLRQGVFQIPRGRSRNYLTQIVQSTLHNDAEYAINPRVCRPTLGKYRVRLS